MNLRVDIPQRASSRASRKRTKGTTDILGTQHNFRSLSIRDLLYARDLYHWHLMNRANVVGTGIGLYLIRNGDPDSESGKAKTGDERRPARTFRNSRVQDRSWPCVLVMVRDWALEQDFGPDGAYHPDQMVPKTLYLPDGRMVPVCVVKVDPAEPAPGVVPDWHWPQSLYGGGMPIVVDVQGDEHRATAGCLVTDGHSVYALTSRHVVGSGDTPVHTIASGVPVPIGRASQNHLTRMPFTKLYPEFASGRTFVNLDVGLIELDDVNAWTSQIYGLGETGALANLNELNITLRLIDAPVVASGAASGILEGRIKALFYRYKSVGGYDYVADFLIAPRQLDAKDDDDKHSATAGQQTQPGDSGAVWHLVTCQDESRPTSPYNGVLRPLCVQWGGQVFAEGAAADQFAFALATSLTSVCQELDVELVLEHNTGVRPYWGQTGHYSIASFAADALPSTGKLKGFIKANLERISFELGDLDPKKISQRIKDAKKVKFVPLADVPDIIWKNHQTKVKGGRDNQFVGGRSTGPEHPTHYADIDVPRTSDHKTLRELSLAKPANLSVGFWQKFYDDTKATKSGKRGLLPFRVWQFFNTMVDAAKAGDAGAFLAAAGLVSHYVGDACQPLHGSRFADGYEDKHTKVQVHHRDGTTTMEPSHVGAGVHSTYETAMIDRFSADIVAGIPKQLTSGPALANITSGKDAATAIVQLMDRSATTIPPTDLTDAYVDAGGKKVVAVQKALWKKFDKQTIKVMADGARVLAKIWQGAWNAGSGDTIAKSKLGPVSEATLMGHYQDKKFVESFDLDHIGPKLK